MDSITHQIAEYSATSKFADLTGESVHAATQRLVDSLGCALGAYDCEPAQIGRRLAAGQVPGKYPGYVLGFGDRLPAEAATFINSAMIRNFDFNDRYPGGHPSDCLGALLAGNTSDKTTLREFLHKIETQYGKAERIWVMDRGIPTEEVLAQMRQSDPPLYYLVGTPKGRLTKLEQQLLSLPWQAVRPGVEVKLLAQEQELYILAQSHDRIHKERAMRRRQLRALVKRLNQLQQMKLNSTQKLLLKLGSAKGQYPAAWRLIDIEMPESSGSSFSFRLNRQKLRAVRRREGRYLLRSNICGRDPAELWQFYIQLVDIEAAFKNLKDDLVLRPIHHQLQHRIEAHIFIAFIAYCLHVTLRARLRRVAGGLTARAVLDKFAAIQMLDIQFPTTDGRILILSRYTEPTIDHKLLLEQLNLTLPPQPPPRITAAGHIVH